MTMAPGPRDSDPDAKPGRPTRTELRKFFRLFRYVRPYRWRFALGVLCLLLTTALSMAFPALLGQLVDAAKGNAEAQQGLTSTIDQVALQLLAVFGLQAIFGFARIYLFSEVAQHLLASVRRDTYAHVVRLPMAFFSQRRVGELNSRISADTALLQDTFTTSLAEILRQVIVVIGGLILLTTVSPKLTLTMLAVIPVVMVVAVFFGRYVKRLGKRVQDQLADTNVVVEETLQGIHNVKAFGNEAWEVARYTTGIEGVRALALKGARWRAAFVSFIILCLFGGVVLVIWRGVHLTATGELSMGQLVSFIMYSIFVGASIGGIPELTSDILKAVGATERLMDLQDEVPEETQGAGPEALQRVQGSITFENVAFHYASRPDVPVLRHVDCTVRPGERVALVGPSGAGKSTIAALIFRFYDPTQGRLLLDGRDMRSLGLRQIRDSMAIVPQEVLLFGGSIRENVAYGRPGATDEEIIAAARKANAHDFIVGFPQGYATVVGERGIQLSGGQRQRIAIARALLKDPAILVLDEATSALDTASEKLVQDALDELMKGRTSIVIAHRLSTVKAADRILVLDRGAIVESGTHAQLISDPGGLYSSLNRLNTAQHQQARATS
jgi:ABC transporter fused permease/ATP-binding protein